MMVNVTNAEDLSQEEVSGCETLEVDESGDLILWKANGKVLWQVESSEWVAFAVQKEGQ